jgi:ADP-ribosylglycohydrolase
MKRYDRIEGAIFGLAYGDSIGFPSLFHRFHALPAKRHEFLWETNKQLDRERLLPLALPFTHRQPEATLDPAPTDDTEYLVLSAEVFLELRERPAGDIRADEPKCPPVPDTSTVASVWKKHVQSQWSAERTVDDQGVATGMWTRFSERAALGNMKAGLEAPATGNDNPLHYEDAGANRAVAAGLVWPGEPAAAAALAAAEASITQSEDGVWGAEAMAFAVSMLVQGGSVREAVDGAAGYFPTGSWISVEHRKCQEALERSDSLHELTLHLATEVINSVYSFGGVAPETVPAALAILEMSEGQLVEAVTASCSIAKSADSLPALVGALAGAVSGAGELGAAWKDQLDGVRGICLPFLAGFRLRDLAARIADVRV